MAFFQVRVTGTPCILPVLLHGPQVKNPSPTKKSVGTQTKDLNRVIKKIIKMVLKHTKRCSISLKNANQNSAETPFLTCQAKIQKLDSTLGSQSCSETHPHRLLWEYKMPCREEFGHVKLDYVCIYPSAPKSHFWKFILIIQHQYENTRLFSATLFIIVTPLKCPVMEIGWMKCDVCI